MWQRATRLTSLGVSLLFVARATLTAMTEAVRVGATVRVVGVFDALTLRQREKQHAGQWVLRREPDNPLDPNAIAVFIGAQKIGYLSAAKARGYAPILDKIGGPIAVSGTQVGITFHVDLPDLNDLRRRS